MSQTRTLSSQQLRVQVRDQIRRFTHWQMEVGAIRRFAPPLRDELERLFAGETAFQWDDTAYRSIENRVRRI
jgi:hypothetical protein